MNLNICDFKAAFKEFAVHYMKADVTLHIFLAADAAAAARQVAGARDIPRTQPSNRHARAPAGEPQSTLRIPVTGTRRPAAAA